MPRPAAKTQTLSAKSTPAKGAASATPGAAAAARKPRSSGDAEGLLSSLLTASQDWMLGFIKAHGFRGVLLLASWPNAAFDLCGICCGAFKMPFWKFFGATLIGKALFKANLQALVCMALFRRSSRDALLGGLDAVLPSGASSRLHAFVNDQIARFKVKVAAKTAAHHAGSWFWVRAAETLRSRRRLVEWLGSLAPDSVAEAWSLVMVLLIATFVARCINTFAQGLKAEEDEAEVAALEGRLLAAKRRQQSG